MSTIERVSRDVTTMAPPSQRDAPKSFWWCDPCAKQQETACTDDDVVCAVCRTPIERHLALP